MTKVILNEGHHAFLNERCQSNLSILNRMLILVKGIKMARFIYLLTIFAVACPTQCGVYIDPIWLNIQHIDRFMKQNRYMMKFFTHIFTILPQMGPRCTPERKFTN